MPSPFPGMDPYLEDPALWPDVHHELISGIRNELNQLLRPKYFVRIELRVYISDEEDPGRRVLVPDVKILESRAIAQAAPRPVPTGIQIAEPIILTRLLDEEIQETFLKVIDREDHSVVTVLEVVSPSNKVSGSQGRASYLQKRYEVLHSPSHWMEIDLLRMGAPLIARDRLGDGDYFVHVARADQRPNRQVWPVRLADRLPVVPVPLRGTDPDVPLDLQVLLDSAYDRAGYDLDMDYRQEPAVPLATEQAAWADQLLKSKGLR